MNTINNRIFVENYREEPPVVGSKYCLICSGWIPVYYGGYSGPDICKTCRNKLVELLYREDRN